jgi:hypothetical protein
VCTVNTKNLVAPSLEGEGVEKVRSHPEKEGAPRGNHDYKSWKTSGVRRQYLRHQKK